MRNAVRIVVRNVLRNVAGNVAVNVAVSVWLFCFKKEIVPKKNVLFLSLF